MISLGFNINWHVPGFSGKLAVPYVLVADHGMIPSLNLLCCKWWQVCIVQSFCINYRHKVDIVLTDFETMNAEKLKQLEAQVRIGGKVLSLCYSYFCNQKILKNPNDTDGVIREIQSTVDEKVILHKLVILSCWVHVTESKTKIIKQTCKLCTLCFVWYLPVGTQ